MAGTRAFPVIRISEVSWVIDDPGREPGTYSLSEVIGYEQFMRPLMDGIEIAQAHIIGVM